jgi:transcriptional/translational regulatory protein YebC/TACO1
VDEEQLFLLATEGGAEDFRAEDDVFEIVCTPEDLQNVKEQLQKNGIEWELASITFIPRNTVRVEGKEARQLLALMEELEDHDDVQNVYSNFDIADEILAQLAQ